MFIIPYSRTARVLEMLLSMSPLVVSTAVIYILLSRASVLIGATQSETDTGLSAQMLKRE
jgi:hypothetical protein